MSILPRARRGYPGVAGVTGAVFLLVVFVVAVIDGVVGIVYTQGRTLESLAGFEYALPALGAVVPFALWQVVPLAVGVFLSFWLVLPIRPHQRVGGVVLRSIVALLIGLVIAVAVEAVRLTTSDLPVNPTQSGAVDNRYYILVLGGLANDAWQLFASSLGLALAAGLAMWGWLRTRPSYGPLRHGGPQTEPVQTVSARQGDEPVGRPARGRRARPEPVRR
ncbi:hypothetical protein GCM10027413_12490 [Conyzicola nivalis]|uniref:Uncharacterized protein n=1 Tax=Conyzicola nivalis TaxID=1477021 RepID=A0A916SH95_9MICO|nr:hypothetical protein [Conyzicola nivalis]GGB00797.1 hypothetical protein GCM10010979_14140 [Conyzicola nivalis]